MTFRKQIGIIGAGISGLCLAWFLQKKLEDKADILIFEKEARVGGWLESLEQGPFLFERGPRTIRSKNALFFELVKDLEIEAEVRTSSQDACIRYLVSVDGSLERLPRGAFDLISSSLGRTMLKGVIRSLFYSKKQEGDTSVESYFLRRFGADFTARCIDPLTAGIYAASPSSLSMKACFPNFQSFFQKNGSTTLYSFQKGMAFLPQTIAKKLSGKLFLSSPVTHVVRNKSKIGISTLGGLYEVDTLFCATPASAVAGLFPEVAPLCLQIPSAKIVSVSFGFSQNVQIPRGFGFLCPSFVEPALLGIIFDSNIFERGDRKPIISVMMGGARDPALFELADEQLIEKARGLCCKYLGISALHEEVVVSRASIPNYHVGHLELVKKIEERLRDIYLVGSGFYGVSIADCIESAYKLAIQYDVDEKRISF